MGHELDVVERRRVHAREAGVLRHADPLFGNGKVFFQLLVEVLVVQKRQGVLLIARQFIDGEGELGVSLDHDALVGIRKVRFVRAALFALE